MAWLDLVKSRLHSFFDRLKSIKPIKQRYQFLIFIIAWAACNEILSRVLFENLKNDVYPMDGDSIGIPMMENLFLGIFIGIFCGLGMLIPKTKILGIIALAFISFGGAMALLGAAYWFFPNHYVAFFGHLIPLSVCAYMFLSAWLMRRKSLID